MAVQVPPDVFHMGPGTLQVSRSQLHGRIRQNLVTKLASKLPEPERGVVLVEGGRKFDFYSTDLEGLFRQESYFHYLFGVAEEDFYGAVDLRTGKSILFMPKLPEAYAVWMGEIKQPPYYLEHFGVDEVRYTEDLPAVLKALAPPAVHVLSGVNTDSGLQVLTATFDGIDQFKVESDVLFDALVDLRVLKTPEELAIIQYVGRIGSEAHVHVMRNCKPGMMEYQLESLFAAYAYGKGGSRYLPYTPICATGPNGAVLHYGHAGAPNDRQTKDGDLGLMDMGCEYYRYGSDITTSFPINGKFTPDQAIIYSAVLDAHTRVKATMAPGVSWPDMHTLTLRCVAQGLLTGGWISGDLEEILAADVAALFMPHGLGHLIGIDTHDVGGYAKGTPERIQRPSYKSLRTARVLQEGMMITVEPGCYFNPALLLPALEDPAKSKFLVRDRILASMAFGGVRIEDNVLITKDGSHSFTHVPRTVEEVEAVMAGGKWEVENELKTSAV